jgi:hypothetical protein
LVAELNSLPSASGWRFDLRDRSPILEIDPHGEIIPIDVDILRGGRYGRIMKTIDFAACQDEATIGVYFARSSGPIPNANCAEFILVSSLRHIVPCQSARGDPLSEPERSRLYKNHDSRRRCVK